jgi:hypothetical protein
LVLVLAYLIFLSAIFAHGLFIWETTLERSITLATGVVVLVVTLVMLRHGALRGRVVIEVREDQRPGGLSFVTVTAAGQPLAAQVTLSLDTDQGEAGLAPADIQGFAALRSAAIQLPATSAEELKVWVHRLTSEWTSQGLPSRVEVRLSGGSPTTSLSMPRGQALVPFSGQAAKVTVVLAEAAGKA